MHQQAKSTQRPSPLAGRFHHRLEELFDQLRDGLKMVDTDELVALLEELVERVDSRMVARYGHGMCPCPSPSCKHQQETCGLSTSVNVFTYSRASERYHERIRPGNDQPEAHPTKEKAKKIVMNAVNGAIAHARETHQSPMKQERQHDKTTPSSAKPHKGGNVLSKLVRQPATDTSPKPYKQVHDIRPPTGSDALAFETVTAGNLQSNRAFALRREARGSLKRYTNRKQTDAIMATMRFDDTDEEQEKEVFYDAEMARSPAGQFQEDSKQRSSSLQSNKYSIYSSGVEETSQTCDCMSPEECRCRLKAYTTSVITKYTHPIQGEVQLSEGGRFATPYGKSKSALINAFDLGRQESPQKDEFGPIKKPQSKGFKRVLPPRSFKASESKKDYGPEERVAVDRKPPLSSGPGSKETSQTDGQQVADHSSDEDVWWNARDRFSSGNIHVQTSTERDSSSADKFVSTTISSDSKKEAILRAHSTGVVTSEACWDTNLIYTVNRTLRESLPKFTGSRRRASGLMQIVGSILNDQELEDDDPCPQYNFSILQELRGDDSYGSSVLTAGDASATIGTQTSKATRNVSRGVNQTFASQTVDVFRDALHCRCAKTTNKDAVGRSQNEIMKVLKDSRENIKVELTLGKEDEPKLAEFVSSFIEAQRRAKHAAHKEMAPGACSECGRSLQGTKDRHENRLTTNNNRSSTPCSPVRSPSPPTPKTTTKPFSDGVDQIFFGKSSEIGVEKDYSAQEALSPLSTALLKEKQDPVISRSSSDPGIQRPLSPFPDNHSEGYSSTHETEEETDFKPSDFLEKNCMYGKKKSEPENAQSPVSNSSKTPQTRQSGGFEVHPGLKDVKFASLGSPEVKKSQPPLDIEDIESGKEVKVTNKGSFLGEICGCN